MKTASTFNVWDLYCPHSIECVETDQSKADKEWITAPTRIFLTIIPVFFRRKASPCYG